MTRHVMSCGLALVGLLVGGVAGGQTPVVQRPMVQQAGAVAAPVGDAMQIAVLQQRIAQLEATVNALVAKTQFITVSPYGVTMAVDGGFLHLKTGHDLTLSGQTAHVVSDADFEVRASGGLAIRASGTALLTAGTVNIGGASGGGAVPAARMSGGQVTPSVSVLIGN